MPCDACAPDQLSRAHERRALDPVEGCPARRGDDLLQGTRPHPRSAGRGRLHPGQPRSRLAETLQEAQAAPAPFRGGGRVHQRRSAARRGPRHLRWLVSPLGERAHAGHAAGDDEAPGRLQPQHEPGNLEGRGAGPHHRGRHHPRRGPRQPGHGVRVAHEGSRQSRHRRAPCRHRQARFGRRAVPERAARPAPAPRGFPGALPARHERHPQPHGPPPGSAS